MRSQGAMSRVEMPVAGTPSPGDVAMEYGYIQTRDIDASGPPARRRRTAGRLLSCAAVLAGLLALSPEALAKVKRTGTWPEAEKKVTLDVSRVPRDEAIKKLAEAAGWSVVVHAPQADPVDIHVKDQPADKVLELLLLDADYIATRDGTLLSIQRAPAGRK
jgi:hypothetical protein